MNSRKSIDAPAMGLMLVLCMIWGLQQVALKVTAAEISPVFQIALRSAIAAVLVAALMAWRGEKLSWRTGRWRPGAVAAVLFGIEFLLVGVGLKHTSAAHVVVFLYTAPIFTALGLHWRVAAERLHVTQWVGIGLAFAGLGLAFFGRASGDGALQGVTLWGDLLALLAGMAWAGTTLSVRCTSLASAPATETLLYQLIGAAVLLTGVAWAQGDAHFVSTPAVWASLAFHGLIVSFASYLAWFALLRRYIVSQLGVFSFLTPLFGVAFGVWWLGEPLEAAFVLGAVLVLAGVITVSGHGWWAARRRVTAGTA